MVKRREKHRLRRAHLARYGIKPWDVVKLDGPCSARCKASAHVGVVESVHMLAGRPVGHISLACWFPKRAVTTYGLAFVERIGAPYDKATRITRKRARRFARNIYGSTKGVTDERR